MRERVFKVFLNDLLKIATFILANFVLQRVKHAD